MVKNKKILKVGTLFSGIGAFEHALHQLNIPHEIQFACDNGEIELPIRYSDLFRLIEGMNEDQIKDYLEKYIGCIGVKKEFRETELNLVLEIALANDETREKYLNNNSPIVLYYSKAGRKSMVKHQLILTQEQIIALTPGMTMKEREQYVNNLYKLTGEHNYVKDAYFANYDIKEEHWHEDVRFLDANEYKGNLDIMVGGSPCQSFSNYGKKLGLEDVRGTLFYDYARVINEAKPKVFIYENVQNLLNHDGGKTWKVMLNVWQSLGYELNFKILDAKDYNHPQLRTRLFLIGIREDIYKKPYSFPEKKELTHKSTEYLQKGPIQDIYYLGEKGFEWVTTPSKNLRRSRVNQDIIGCQTANQQDNWIGDFRVEHPKSHHYNDERIHIGKFDFNDGNGMVDAVARKMTPRECMNLMGFDDSFNIAVSDSIAYRHAGNSIVVPVLKELIKSLENYL
ncbi:MAG: DNA cytosine methyltransferase [Paludibacteraceae bacterium]|nr:DNA cytosine methyltransferase [Paludibacteraceae bacterium]